MSENNDNSNESSSMSSDSILQSSRLTGGGSVGGNPVLRAGVLRPSLLGPSRLSSAVASNSNTTTNNVTLSNEANGAAAATTSVVSDSNKDGGRKSKENTSNPFLKDHKDEDEEGDADDQQDSEETAKSNDNGESNDERDVLSFLLKNGRERANIFTAAKNSIPLVEKSGFVFGQNVHERVVGENLKSDSTTNADNTESSVSTAGEGLLFSSVIQNAAAKSSESCDSTSGKDGSVEAAKSLTEVAREYEESRAQKRKYEEVETFTGEENEVNIVDLNCKLFAFVNSNWEERGRGSLRLNDSKIMHECSRLVFRTSGNLRLLLNTKVWAGMVVERSSQKSLRLTAMDNTGKIKIFLVMARPVEINQLHNTLAERIEKRQLSHPDELLCAEGNNSSAENSTTEDIKNGSLKSSHEGVDEVEEEEAGEAAAAAAAAEPEENDNSDERSPKKPILSVQDTSLATEEEQQDASEKQ